MVSKITVEYVSRFPGSIALTGVFNIYDGNRATIVFIYKGDPTALARAVATGARYRERNLSDSAETILEYDGKSDFLTCYHSRPEPDHVFEKEVRIRPSVMIAAFDTAQALAP